MHKKILVLVLALLLVSVGAVSAQSGNLPGSGWWSGQQIQNVGSASTSVLFTAYDEDGNDFPCGPAKSAGVGQSVNFLTNTDCTVPAGFVGSAVVSADQPIAAIVNVVNMPTGRAAGMYRGTDGADVANTIAFPLMKNNYFGRYHTLHPEREQQRQQHHRHGEGRQRYTHQDVHCRSGQRHGARRPGRRQPGDGQ